MRLPFLTPLVASTLALDCLTAQRDTTDRAVVHGVVRDTLGRPLRNAFVQILSERVEPATGSPGKVTRFRVTTDYDSTDGAGRFRFESLAGGRYALRADAVWMEGDVDSLIVGANATVSVVIRMRARYHAETPTSVRTARLARLAEAEARWAARRPARYRLTVKVECFCGAMTQDPTTLEFFRDSLVGIVDSTGARHATTDPWWKGFSVPAQFAAAEAAIRDLETQVEKIEYDPTYGFLTFIDTDTVYGYTDGRNRQRITQFRAIP